MWIVFTGLIRDDKIFSKKLKLCKKLIEKKFLGGVVFSTWLGEVDKYPQISKQLNEINARLVESTEPTLRIQGHVIHQMKTLHYGLLACPEQACVLKARPDIGKFDEAYLTQFAENRYHEEISYSDGWPRIFHQKIFVDGGLMMHPFYLVDINFFGKNSDLKKLINFDLSYEVLFNNMTAEQYFFSKPFIDKFPIFKLYFTIHQNVIHSHENLTEMYNQIFIKSNFLLTTFVTYAFILNKYFLFPASKTPEEGHFYRFEDFFSADLPGLKKRKQVGGAIHFFDDYWLKIFFSDYILNNPLYESLVEKIEVVKDYNFSKNYPFNPLFPSEEIIQLSKIFERDFNNYRTKINKSNKIGRFIIKGADIRFKSLKGRDDLIKTLEAEINTLRRR